MEKPSPTTLWLLGGFAALLLIIFVIVGRQGGDQDRLGDDATVTAPEQSGAAKGCSGKNVAAALKSALFARALETRGKDEEAYRQVASAAVIRMDNEALEDEVMDGLACTATVAIDLPPGIVASGGRRNLMGNVDYLVSADGISVALRNGPSLADELAGLARSTGAITAPLDSPDLNVAAPVDEPVADVVEPPPPQPRADASPSFDCAKARTRGEQAVCSDFALAALDRQMAAQYSRAMAGASPDRQAQLRQTRDRFLRYRDGCPNAQCIADAYNGRMREIADIVAGRWQPPR
jgi:hypothetical protein